jgi:hypothetical protein
VGLREIFNMAGAQFLHGIETIETDVGPRPIAVAASSIIGIIGTAPNADPLVFPLNKVVEVASDYIKAEALGMGGTLRDNMRMIFAQAGAVVLVVRVAEGTTPAQTISNIIGDPIARTGVWAFLAAKSTLGMQPKILIAPGFTSARTIGVVSGVSLSAGGTGYTAAPTVTFTTGGGANVTAAVAAGAVTSAAVVSGGSNYVGTPTAVFSGTGTGAAGNVVVAGNVVTGVTITAGGTGYTVAPTVSIVPSPGAAATGVATIASGVVTGVTMTRSGFGYIAAPRVVFAGGGGVGATATSITAPTAGNPVIAEFEAIASRLRAVWIKDGPNSLDSDAVMDRGDWGSKRGFIVDPHVLVWDTTSSTVLSRPASSSVAGLISKTDNAEGFWVSPSNKTISGIIGTARPIDFNLGDPTTQSNYLNSQHVATIIRQDGYRLWGNRTTSNDPLWAFLSVRRTCDIIYDSLDKALLYAIDRGLNATSISNIAESVNNFMGVLKGQGAIINGRCWIDPLENTPSLLQQGILTVSFDIEPPAPMEHLIFKAYRNGDYYKEVIDKVNRQITGG